MKNIVNDFPSPEKIQKEFAKYLKEKVGVKVNEKPSADSVPEKGDEVGKTPEEHVDFEFTLKPKDIKAHLDKYVIRQDEAKKVLSIAVCDHYNNISHSLQNKKRHYIKQNVIVLGSTGVGKTYLIKCIAEMIGVPFVKSDATRFSETGYVGRDVDDLIRDLVDKADGDIELAQYGIVYIDEIDKIASSTDFAGKDVSGTGVQRGLLKLMEETEVPVKNPMDITAQIKTAMEFQRKGKVSKDMINTKNILFIVSGAFAGLDKIIEKRTATRKIGFDSEIKTREEIVDTLKDVTTRDFIDFGLEPEFIGRLPVRTVCEDLDADALYEILKYSEDSVIKQYRDAFDAYGIAVDFNENSLKAIAEKAAKEKTGARALVTVIEKMLRDYKYELPSSLITKFTVNEKMLSSPKEEFAKILSKEKNLQHHSIEKQLVFYADDFKQKHDLNIKFSDDAVNYIENNCGDNLRSFLDAKLKNYQYGLNLIKIKSGKGDFTLTEKNVKNPDTSLDDMIREIAKS